MKLKTKLLIGLGVSIIAPVLYYFFGPYHIPESLVWLPALFYLIYVYVWSITRSFVNQIIETFESEIPRSNESNTRV